MPEQGLFYFYSKTAKRGPRSNATVMIIIVIIVGIIRELRRKENTSSWWYFSTQPLISQVMEEVCYSPGITDYIWYFNDFVADKSSHEL